MNDVEIAKKFAESFKVAAGEVASTYANLIRFMAVMMLIIAIIACINHFLDQKEKVNDNFLVKLGSRLIRIAIGFCVFIFCLAKG